MFAALFASWLVVLPQGSQSQAPAGLTVVIVDVGQGDGIVIRSPDGRVHVVDAGPEGQGMTSMVPAVQALAPTAFGYTVLSHFHTDHCGGLDDVLNQFPFQVALDRGDVNRPSNSSVNSYLAATAGRRQTIAVGAIYQLGGGATMQCLCANGFVAGGTFIDPTVSAQEENSRSIALRVVFGDFSMWLGGDLTGGGNSTADVESAASLICGDIDVYKLNHHGSNTSTNLNLVARLSPELAVVSCGTGNSFGHPTPTVVNRLNQAAAARALLSTTSGSANTVGFSVAGTIRIDTDGYRYRATAPNGDFLDFFCDEVAPHPLAAGDLRLSELHRQPAAVPDTAGEYLEIVNVSPRPAALAGMQLSDNGATLTLASNLMLVPGRALLFQIDGAPGRNGGQPLGIAMPANTIALGNGSDVVTLRQGATVLDSLAYSAGFPGGAGVAAERRDLRGPQTGPNWGPAPNQFGSGDRGSPGRRNDLDVTVHPVGVAVTTRPGRFTVHGPALSHPGQFSILGLAYGDAPGFPFGGAWIPLNFDPLFQAALGAPGVLDLVPAGGYRSFDVPLPQPNPVAGVPLFAAHIVLDFSLTVTGVSAAVSFVTP